LQALFKLEAGAGIQILAKLETKLREFKKRANIHELCAYQYSDDCPLVDIYISSWLEDRSIQPTWENFLAILKDIGLQDVADNIHGYLSSTIPYPSITEPGKYKWDD
jgi:precorrin-4 methylase